MLQKISDDSFDEQVIDFDSVFVLLFSSPWCSTCKNITDLLGAISEGNSRARFGRIDITTSPKKPVQYGVMGIPTVLIFKAGKEITRLTGNVSDKEIVSELERLL